jgi:hypothetical protein
LNSWALAEVTRTNSSGVTLPPFTPSSQITAMRSSMPPQPFGIFVKSFFPIAFCSALKVQWSVAVVCRCPASPRQSAAWCSFERKGGLITWAAAVAKFGLR